MGIRKMVPARSYGGLQQAADVYPIGCCIHILSPPSGYFRFVLPLYSIPQTSASMDGPDLAALVEAGGLLSVFSFYLPAAKSLT